MNQKKLIWIGALIIVVIIAGYVVWSKKSTQNQNGLSQSVPSAINQNINENPVGSSGMSSADNSLGGQANTDVSPDEKRSDEKPDEAFRQQVMAYVNKNLNKLASAPANDKWDVPTFYFVGNSNVYVELYAIDTDLAGAKMLYKAEKDGSGNIKLTEVARYKEGEDDWILSSGTDTYADYVMEEYDLNEDNNKWEKTDEFSEDLYSEDDTDSTGNSATGGVLP